MNKKENIDELIYNINKIIDIKQVRTTKYNIYIMVDIISDKKIISLIEELNNNSGENGIILNYDITAKMHYILLNIQLK